MSEIPSRVPAVRVRVANDAAVADGDYVLYWMIANRRTRYNFALDRALDWARALGKPLLIFEALRCGYPWASDRLHHFVLEGMRDQAAALSAGPVGYFPYVEQNEGDGSGLLEALADRAAVIVTDEFPCFFLPRMVAAAAGTVSVRLESVDSNGLLPIYAGERIFHRAVDFRRFLQKELPSHLGDRPLADPLADVDLPPWHGLPESVTRGWPAADLEALLAPGGLAELPIDHEVPPVSDEGGARAAAKRLDRFLDRRLRRYAEGRNRVTDRATSELSAHLHFGHLSTYEIFEEVTRSEEWTPWDVSPKATASRSGWWGMSPEAESFLDELLTWRELGYRFCAHVPDYDRYESLPEWARKTLGEHESDARPYLYDLETFEEADTHDELWNAAQRELVRDGRIHNYLRMLWGKKILEWTPSPRVALEVMIELNNKYALDGRNPNSYSGIFWCLGRFDRAWGPERPVFGKIRFMSSDSTRRKLDAKSYIAEYGRQASLF